MEGAMKKVWGWDSTNEVWRKIEVDENGILKTGVESVVAGAIQLYLWDGSDWVKASCNASGQLEVILSGQDSNIDVDVQNYPADYPDSSVLAKLADILTELQAKLETADIDIDVNKYISANIKNLPADYPDADVLSKLADILTELNAKLETGDLDIDVSGYLSTNVKDIADGEIKNYGDVSGSWVKQPLVFGFTEVYHDITQNTNLGAGSQTVALPDVASGYIHYVTRISIYLNSATITHYDLRMDWDGNNRTLETNSSPSLTGYNPHDLQVFVKAGDTIHARLYGCTAGDDCYILGFGYKMAIA